MSGAMTRYPASERALIWCLHEYQDSGNPWHKRTKGPAPASAIWILMPFDSTNLCSANIANLAVIYFGKNATSMRGAISTYGLITQYNLDHDKHLERLQDR